MAEVSMTCLWLQFHSFPSIAVRGGDIDRGLGLSSKRTRLMGGCRYMVDVEDDKAALRRYQNSLIQVTIDVVCSQSAAHEASCHVSSNTFLKSSRVGHYHSALAREVMSLLVIGYVLHNYYELREIALCLPAVVPNSCQRPKPQVCHLHYLKAVTQTTSLSSPLPQGCDPNHKSVIFACGTPPNCYSKITPALATDTNTNIKVTCRAQYIALIKK
ncbi:hypothetical protein RRG08_042460 [Elysia crispata]|uniref:Uncharacterized protein n=1 Tax=Elysia crispata TaxID=231223 RepID=A0AAE1DDP7_9GAST|nr:hypothetical protein RRG08_042460 [Elysia crispata]